MASDTDNHRELTILQQARTSPGWSGPQALCAAYSVYPNTFGTTLSPRQPLSTLQKASAVRLLQVLHPSLPDAVPCHLITIRFGLFAYGDRVINGGQSGAVVIKSILRYPDSAWLLSHDDIQLPPERIRNVYVPYYVGSWYP